MRKGLNKVMIIGYLGDDPIVRYTADQKAVTSISVATSSSWIDKIEGIRKEETEWHKIVLYGKLAEIARDFLKKGKQVFIEGYLKTRKYKDKNGIEKYTTEIITDNLQLIGGRNEKPESNYQYQKNLEMSADKPSHKIHNEEDDNIPF